MGARRVPGSFRDPSGYLFRRNGEIFRQVAPLYREPYDQMMSSGFHAAAVAQGLLIDHEEVDEPPATEPAYKVLKPTQLPFVSYPYEWSFSQLKEAAALTLRLQKLALDYDLSLKDASAYNVQLLDGAPIFIDTLSFEPYRENRPWVAYRQFCQHFLAPLALMAYRHVELAKLFRLYIDGVPLDLASALLPRTSWLRASLTIHLHLHARMQKRHSGGGKGAAQAKTARVSKAGLLGIIDGLESATRKLEWKPAGTEWADYYDETNYSEAAQQGKARLIESYLELVKPGSVWDLGANTGAYSRLASSREIDTIAFDVDPAAVEKNYREVRERGERQLWPLVMDLTNPSPGLGWNGEERSSFQERGPADLGLALALVHHLAISNNVPLGDVARFLQGICRFLVIEFVPKSDSQVEHLLATRDDIFPDYTREGFEAAFEEHFRIQETARVEGSERRLYLMARREGD